MTIEIQNEVNAKIAKSLPMPMDKHFRVEVISQTPNPQTTIWYAMHQCYSEYFVSDENPPATEQLAGESIIKNLLKGGRGHYGPFEHPQIVLNVGWLSHSVMQQIRTHRIGVSFDVQSFRYSGERLVKLGNMFSRHLDSWADSVEHILIEDDGAEWNQSLADEIEKVFYLRPVGEYTDRQGKKYKYSKGVRDNDLIYCAEAAVLYMRRVVDQGFSEEHARGLIPFDVRQHWVMSANVRSFLHLMDLRWKKDAQLEAQQLCDIAWVPFKAWVPQVAEWYEKARMKKARLAP